MILGQTTIQGIANQSIEPGDVVYLDMKGFEQNLTVFGKEIQTDGSVLIKFGGDSHPYWVTGESYTAADHNKLVDETLDELFEKPSCSYCRSEYHDAKYHPGTCTNCGGPAGK